jgi:hypothetical protein
LALRSLTHSKSLFSSENKRQTDFTINAVFPQATLVLRFEAAHVTKWYIFFYVPLPKKFAPVFVEASMHPISKQE